MFISLFPNWIGQTQPRVVSLEGDVLTLETVTPINFKGRTVNSRLIWHRANLSEARCFGLHVFAWLWLSSDGQLAPRGLVFNWVVVATPSFTESRLHLWRGVMNETAGRFARCADR